MQACMTLLFLEPVAAALASACSFRPIAMLVRLHMPDPLTRVSWTITGPDNTPLSVRDTLCISC